MFYVFWGGGRGGVGVGHCRGGRHPSRQQLRGQPPVEAARPDAHVNVPWFGLCVVRACLRACVGGGRGKGGNISL